MSFTEKQKRKIREKLIDRYEGKIREIAEETGYSEEYVRRNYLSL